MTGNPLNKPVEAQHIEPEMLDNISAEVLLATGHTGSVKKELVAVVGFGKHGNGALGSVGFSVRVDGVQVLLSSFQEHACKAYNTLPEPATVTVLLSE